MAIEIERKFLLKNDSWKASGVKPLVLKQGYIMNSKTGVVRIRISDSTGFITVKGRTRNASRLEYEYEIPVKDAEEMLHNLCEKPLVEKNRYNIDHGGFQWSVDQFLGANLGLVVAEIELDSEEQAFERPPWLGKEVTGDSRYFNSNLIATPYPDWEKPY
ncbi:MAG: CYTH domain-containing protein [Desulfobacteraceae bacterium]|nr:CYTH domain-containing protein [Desulfobacteraceae bacterium]